MTPVCVCVCVCVCDCCAQVTLADLSNMGQKELQATAFELQLLGLVPKQKSGKHLAADLEAVLTKHVRADRGDQLLLDLLARPHDASRKRAQPKPKPTVRALCSPHLLPDAKLCFQRPSQAPSFHSCVIAFCLHACVHVAA